MTTTNPKQFLINENIPHYSIWYFISSTKGGEENNEQIDKVNSKLHINPRKPSSYFIKNKNEGYDAPGGCQVA